MTYISLTLCYRIIYDSIKLKKYKTKNKNAMQFYHLKGKIISVAILL